jgi:hypothetical protein
LQNVSKAIFLLSIGKAQRLVAQALGRVRLVDTILAGNYKPHSNVSSQSLGQVACSHLLGSIFCDNDMIFKHRL